MKYPGFTAINWRDDLSPGRLKSLRLSTRSPSKQSRGRAAALDPESHWIAICTDGYEFDPESSGKAVADFLISVEKPVDRPSRLPGCSSA